jgi:glucan phosphoethanolaminetransferase (alkaline phosphatase superfamily)
VDGDLLPFYQRTLDNNAQRKFILLHTIGSHWWYNAHYTDSFEVFKPIARSRIVSSNTRVEMINAYDNTVLYTDFFVYTLIEQLREKKAILIYQSDHGEGLGEEGAWFHAADNPYVHQAACFVWMSPAYKAAHPEAYAQAQNNRLKRFRTDYLFHSLLDAAGIRSPYLKDSLSIFR